MSTLAYKPVPAEHHGQFAHIDAQSFDITPRRSREWLEEPRDRDLRALYDGDRIAAQLVIYPLRVRTGAGDLPCGGLGSVATPPEQRRRGHIGRLLHEAVDELRARGTPLCMLYPFKNSFYGRFGWATFVERKVYSGSPQLFAGFRLSPQGAFEQVGEEALPELEQVYSGALRGRFGPLARSQQWWKEVIGGTGALKYTYLWRDEQGAARSYVVFRLEKRSAGMTMACRETVALDPLARQQLFALMGLHQDQVAEVVFRAPADAPVNLLMPDPLRCEVEPHFMLRTLDVAALLSAYHYPADLRGRLAVGVADSWLDHNQGVFELEVAGGAGHCRRLPDGAPADLRCDVGVLTQLVARYVRPRTAAAFGLLAVESRPALDLAERLFAGLAPFNSDFF